MKKGIFTFFLFSALLFSKDLLLFFDANKEISSRELYDALNLHKPYFYEFYLNEAKVDRQEIDLIKDALKNYYRSRGFYHTEIQSRESENSVIIIINENAPIIVKSVESLSTLNIDQIVPFKVGDIFDAQKFSQSKKDVKLLYANNHFCNASLDAKAWIDIVNNYAYLTYNVAPNSTCYFKKIDLVETKNIDEEILRSILYIKESELFSTQDIAKSYEALYRYEGVSKAIIDTKVDTDGNGVDVRVSVFENEKPIRTEFGVGFSSDEGAMVLFGAKDRNFLRNLKTVGIQTRLTEIKQSIKINFDMPLLNNNSSGFEVGYENEEFNAFKEDRVLADLFLKQRFVPYLFKESLIFDNSRTYGSDDELLFPKSSLFIISPRVEWSYDTRDKILDASSGYFINTELRGSLKSGISDASYYKFKADGGYIFPIDSSTLGLRATFGTLGVSDGYIPSSYRFFAGGMYSNRAYGYRKLGPIDLKNNPIGSDSIFEATAEIRFNIYDNFRGVLFSDNSYLGNGSIPSYDNGYYSVGFGVRYKTPIGPIAIDFGFDTADPMKYNAIHFHIGELF